MSEGLQGPKFCHQIVVTLLKMQPYHIQSSREIVPPSGNTSPLPYH